MLFDDVDMHSHSMYNSIICSTTMMHMRLQIAASLGPFGEVLRGSERDSGGGDIKADGEGAGAGVILTGAVRMHPDKLSCAQILLAAARVFASQKIKALVADVEQAALQLG